jgi:putative ABC transport system permease protein
MDLTPGAITAAMVGVESRLQIFNLQRWINKYPEKPLLAVLPGVALQELRGIVGIAETALVAVLAMVVVTALLGMAAMILSSLYERRREMAILRAVGASPVAIAGLLMLGAVLMAVLGALLGPALLYLGLLAAQPSIDAAFGLFLSIEPPTPREALMIAAVVFAAAATSLVPALRAYRLSLADGMTVRA